MNRFAIAIALVTATTLSACANKESTPPQVITNTPVPITPPTVTPLDLQNVKWTVHDYASLKKMVADAEKKGQPNVIFYVLTQDDYNALAMNVAEVKRYISDQKAASDFLSASIITNSSKPEAPVEKK